MTPIRTPSPTIAALSANGNIVEMSRARESSGFVRSSRCIVAARR